MLNGPALDLLQPKNDRSQIQISVDNGLLVIQFAKDGWIAMTREESIQFVKILADRINGMAR